MREQPFKQAECEGGAPGGKAGQRKPLPGSGLSRKSVGAVIDHPDYRIGKAQHGEAETDRQKTYGQPAHRAGEIAGCYPVAAAQDEIDGKQRQ